MRETREADWPWATIAVSGAILLVFAVESALWMQDELGLVTEVRTGATDYASVFEGGEWWRLLAAAFCHGNLLHAVLNGTALIQLGTLVEEVYGRARFLAVYWLSCLASSFATSSVGVVPSVGASGGIMGLVGFLIAARYLHAPSLRAFWRAVLGRQLLFWTAVIFGLGLLLQAASAPFMLDNYGHAGGLVLGLLLGVLVRGTESAGFLLRALAGGLSLLALVSLGLTAARGGESARIVRALQDTEQALRAKDVAAVRSALASLDGLAPERVCGRSVAGAEALVRASIAAVRTADAVRYGTLARKLDPVLGGAVLAEARLAAGDEAEAKAELARFGASAPPEALERVGIALEEQGRSAFAVWFFESALARTPDDPSLLNDLAWTLLTAKDSKVRDPQRAYVLARRGATLSALSGRPELPALVLDTLAEAEFQIGSTAEALAHQEKAVQLARAAGNVPMKELEDRLAKIRAAAR